MADSTTTNLLLTKPEVGASTDSWGNKVNADLDLVDSIFAAAGTGTSVGLNVGSGKTLTLAGTVKFAGSTSGTTTVAATAVAGTTTLTLPAATDTLVGKATTDTLTNKTLTTPVISSLSSASATALTLQSAGTTAVTIDTSQNVGIGTTSPSYRVDAVGSGSPSTGILRSSSNLTNSTTKYGYYTVGHYTNSTAPFGFIQGESNSTENNVHIGGGAGEVTAATRIDFYTAANNTTSSGTERMRIDSSGNLLVGTTSASVADVNGVGTSLNANGNAQFSRASGGVVNINRKTDDGVLIYFQQDATVEGTISVSGTTVSYNGGHLSRYAQITTAKDESILKGTVLSNLDAMNVYIAPTTYWTEEDELPEGVNVGDVKVETHEVANEQLNKVKVSDVEGDVNVAGVFVNWSYDEQHSIDEINMAMTGDMIIRIAQGVTVVRGDLLMSAGNGTAKPQGDDIVRSKTVAKVTSNHVTCTYADGSYCVPCVLMAC